MIIVIIIYDDHHIAFSPLVILLPQIEQKNNILKLPTMKTKNLVSLLVVLMSTLSVSFAQTAETQINILNKFSFTEYLLMGLCTVMLVVIWILAKTLKTLLEQMR